MRLFFLRDLSHIYLSHCSCWDEAREENFRVGRSPPEQLPTCFIGKTLVFAKSSVPAADIPFWSGMPREPALSKASWFAYGVLGSFWAGDPDGGGLLAYFPPLWQARSVSSQTQDVVRLMGESVCTLKKTKGPGISEFGTFLHPSYGPCQGPLCTWLSSSVMAPFAHGVKVRNGASPAAGPMDSWVGAEVISVNSHRDLGHLHFCRLDRKGLPSGFPSVFSLHGVQHHTNWTGTKGSPLSRNKAWKRFNIMQAGWWSISGHQVWDSTDTHRNSIPQLAVNPLLTLGHFSIVALASKVGCKWLLSICCQEKHLSDHYKSTFRWICINSHLLTCWNVLNVSSAEQCAFLGKFWLDGCCAQLSTGLFLWNLLKMKSVVSYL